MKNTTHSYSAIATNQTHEQTNASVKGDGGAVGLTENPAALHRWKVSVPEMARLIGEFAACTEKRKETDTPAPRANETCIWYIHEMSKHQLLP